jgi:hypothetical protein
MSKAVLILALALFFVGQASAQPQNITKVEKVCVTNDAGFVLNWQLTDLNVNTQSMNSGNYPIDQTRWVASFVCVCIFSSLVYLAHYVIRRRRFSPRPPIALSRSCLEIQDIPYVSKGDVILAYINADGGIQQTSSRAVMYGGKNGETATFSCSGTVDSFSCDLL